MPEYPAQWSNNAGTVVGSVDSSGNLILKGSGTFDGYTLTGSELAAIDGVTAGVVAASKAAIVDANKDIGDFRNLDAVNFDAGASGTAGTVDVFPATASKGKLILAAVNNDGAFNVTVSNAAVGQSSVLSFPDPGAATANVLLTDQTNDKSLVTATATELNVLDGVTAGTALASSGVVVDASKNITSLGTIGCGEITAASVVCTAGATFGGGYGATGATISTDGVITANGAITGEGLTIAGVATGLDHPIDLNSITAMTGDETTDCGNVIKINRSGGAIGGTHSGIICKNYISGGAVDGTALVSGFYVNLKYEPDTENVAAEVSLIEAHLYSDSSDAIDYGMYVLAPDDKIVSLFGVSGDMVNFMEIKADGNAGFTVGATMTKDPAGDAEDGFLTIKIEGGKSYQIPCYEA